MNILVTVNDNYVRPLVIMLESLFDHETEKIDLYLLYSDVSEQNRASLRELIEGRGHCFFPVLVGDDAFQDAPVIRYYSREMYYRLLSSRLLPETVDRVLYLDPDILIRGPVAPFYHMEFAGNQLIGVGDYGVNCLHPQRKDLLGLKRDDIYINSGVLLLNLEEMRKRFVLKDFMLLLERFREDVAYPDQDIINLYFRDSMGFADKIYNYNPGFHTLSLMMRYLLGKDKGSPEPVIVHYMGRAKPWQLGYFSKYFHAYFRYLKPHLSGKERAAFLLRPFVVFWELATAVLMRILVRLGLREDKDR